MIKKSDRAIVFLAWGEKYINEVMACIANSKLPSYDIILITDHVSEVDNDNIIIIRADFGLNGLLRKTELMKHIPKDYSSYLFLDSDTKVISDVEFGFEKAELHGIAISPAPHYSLDCFWGFGEIMKQEGVKHYGQLQYNTGVIFFSLTKEVIDIFNEWSALCSKYSDIFENDQPYLSLAIEKHNYNPYTLSINYNYRGFGEAISGMVRIWHSHKEMPSNINVINELWPPRRVIDGNVHYTRVCKNKWYLDPPAWLK